MFCTNKKHNPLPMSTPLTTQSPNQKYVIGIDLATTYSCVGVFKDGSVQILPNEFGNRTMPSVVAFTDTEKLVGEAAKNQAAVNPANTIFDIKRLIGRKFSDPIVQSDIKLWPFKVVRGDADKPLVEVTYKNEVKRFSPEEISSMILNKLKTVAQSALGCEVTDAVITCPAYFNDSQRQSTKDAATIAGLNPLRIINEPTSASLAYGLDKKDQKERNVLIFDFGGGTHDVSILNIADGVFQVKSTNGNTHLGGADIDALIVHLCLKDFKLRYKIDLTSNQRALKRLNTACEHAKRVLSTQQQTTIEIDSLADGIDYSYVLTRARFEDICSQLFRDTLVPVENVIRDSKLSKDQIDEIVLVGGSSRIPKIQELLVKFFNGKTLCKSINPDECVAHGAAIQAAILSGNKDKSLQDIILLDVCPLSLGIEVQGSIMNVIIPRNTPIPTKKTQSFSTNSDNQSSVVLRVFEGERQLTKDNNLLGTFTLDGLPPMPRGTPKIDITYDLDTNGMMNVTAIESSTKNTKKITIKNERGRLSADEIERMLAEAERFREDDEKIKQKFTAKQDLESFLYTTRNAVQDKSTREKLGANVDRLETIVSDGFKWVKVHFDESVDVYKNKLKELEELVKPFFEGNQSGDGNQSGEGNQSEESSNVDEKVKSNPFMNRPDLKPQQSPSQPKVEELD